jgi:hypothetical protein
VSNRTINLMPTWYRQYRCQIQKGALKAQSSASMRARNRAAMDALRHGADPDAATLPTRSRDVSDRWAFD